MLRATGPWFQRYNDYYQMKIWSSHLLDNLSNCLMNLKNSGDSTGFEPMTSVMPVQCSNQLSYEVKQLRAGQFVGLMFSRERNVIWSAVFEIKWTYEHCTGIIGSWGRGFESRWVTWIFQVHETIMLKIVQQVRGSYLHLIIYIVSTTDWVLTDASVNNRFALYPDKQQYT